MLHNSIVGMLNGVIVQIELIPVLAHLCQIASEHLIHTLRKSIDIIAGAPISIAVLLGDAARVAVRVGGGYDRLLFHQIGQQTRRIVGDSEAVVQEDETHIAGTD